MKHPNEIIKESGNFKSALVLSLILHIVAFTFAPFAKKKSIIYVSFPIELVPMPPVFEKVEEQREEKKEVIAVKKVVQKKPEKKVKEKEAKPQPPSPPQPQTLRQPLSSLTIEAAKFPYMYYLGQIRKKVAENWVFSRESGMLRSVVYFRIKSNGEITAAKLEETSGDKFFDQICLRAVQLSEPFPPLPAGYQEDYLGVYFEFAFRE
ncbi:MAG: energy transducer TonB [Elusimicrobiota bacterium]